MGLKGVMLSTTENLMYSKQIISLLPPKTIDSKGWGQKKKSNFCFSFVFLSNTVITMENFQFALFLIFWDKLMQGNPG